MEPALGGVGAAKEVLQNSASICTTAPWSWQLHRVLELGCLAGKLAGVAGVQLQSHAKHPLITSPTPTSAHLRFVIRSTRYSMRIVVGNILHIHISSDTASSAINCTAVC